MYTTDHNCLQMKALHTGHFSQQLFCIILAHTSFVLASMPCSLNAKIVFSLSKKENLFSCVFFATRGKKYGRKQIRCMHKGEYMYVYT